jgi:hypothetical protein
MGPWRKQRIFKHLFALSTPHCKLQSLRQCYINVPLQMLTCKHSNYWNIKREIYIFLLYASYILPNCCPALCHGSPSPHGAASPGSSPFTFFMGFYFNSTNFVQDSKYALKMFLKGTFTPDCLGAFWPVCLGLGLGIKTSTGSSIFQSLLCLCVTSAIISLVNVRSQLV